MERYFRTKEGQLVNVVEHTLEQIEKHPTLRIRIGTDSQTDGDETTYVTAIVYRYDLRGAHYIYYKENVSRVKSEYMRLYDEGVRTIEAAGFITEELPVSIDGLEFDFADVKKTVSSKLVADFRGWTQAIGLTPLFKSGEMIASRAADHLCRR